MAIKFIIGVVGICAAGKSTLIAGLNNLGYIAKQIAQEHSYVPDMWRRISNPDILVYLDVSYIETKKRKNLNWTQKEYDEQNYRLRHAREECDIYINTDELSVQEVLEAVVSQLPKIYTKY